MEEPEYLTFVDRYRSLPDEELLQLFERKSDLQPIALKALDQELASRRVSIDALRLTQAADKVADEVRAEQQFELHLQREARKERRVHWYMIAATPLALLAYISEQPDPQQGIVRPLTYLLFVIAVYWIAAAIRWVRSARKAKVDVRDA
jgi:hypothetical protein